MAGIRSWTGLTNSFAAVVIPHALIRTFAAAVRDRQPPHQHAKDDAVKLALALCSLLDLLDGRRRQGKDARAVEESVRMVLGGPRARGCEPLEGRAEFVCTPRTGVLQSPSHLGQPHPTCHGQRPCRLQGR
jgi:hypothetical protein